MNEPAGTAWADSNSQPEDAAAADTEAAVAADSKGGPLLEDRLIQWGGKQKRKRIRPGSVAGPCGLPDPAGRAPQQKLLPPYFSSAIADATGHATAAATVLAATADTDDDDDHAVANDMGIEQPEQQDAGLKGVNAGVSWKPYYACAAFFCTLIRLASCDPVI